MKCRCRTDLEKIAMTQPATTMTYTSATSYYQCRKCSKLYQEITISDSSGNSTSSGFVGYKGRLIADEIKAHIPKMRGVLSTEYVNNIIGGNKK